MDNILFKQSFRGFDRTEVLSYIDDLTGQMNARAEGFAATQRELEAKLEEMTRSLKKSEECLALCNEKGRKLAEQVDSLKNDNTALKEKIERYKTAVFDREKELTVLRADYVKLTEDNEALTKDNEHWKARQDDIAEVMVDAQNRARQIIDSAHRQARRAKEQLDVNAADLAGKVSDVKSEIARIEAQLEASFNTLSLAMQKMEKAGSVIEDQVNEYRDRVARVDEFIMKEKNEEPERVPSPERKALTDNVLDTITRLLEK